MLSKHVLFSSGQLAASNWPRIPTDPLGFVLFRGGMETFGAHSGGMDQIQYSIIEEPVGAFIVEIQDFNEISYRVDGFRTKGEADAWIQERQQKVSASDRWEATQFSLIHSVE
jgi:hypothetical protein